MNNVIEASGLFKSFGQTTALSDVSFTVGKSEIFGFIGPDGSGKTTLFRILTTLMLPDKGSVLVLGHDCVKDFRQLRKKIGYMPGRFSLYQDLSVEENLNFYATVFGTTVSENYDLIRDIYSQIEPFRKRLAGKLSGGMKQKLALSCALIHKPALLVLDEPTTGVDAVSRAEFWTMLSRLKKHNITVVVSTPYMDEAMKCDRIALIQKGRILAVDTPQYVCKGFSRKMFVVKADARYKLIKALRSYHETLTAFPFGDSVHLTTNSDTIDDTLRSHLRNEGIENYTIEESVAGIEDRFLELMDKI
ncbi:MAG TPA: ABC transporter ATP-binding protein [Bacteroidales bacterium]|nr:ABC transporter ATP-binding protein [Bacteroidales bacterium]